MQLYFIRHAQSWNNALYTRTGGSAGRMADPILTEKGWEQTKLVAARFAHGLKREKSEGWDPQNRGGYYLTHLYTSLMVRSINTSQMIAGATGLSPIGWPDVHERGGIYETDQNSGQRSGLPGGNRKHFQEHYPDLKLPDELGDSGWWNRPYEADEIAMNRARQVLAILIEKHGASENRVAMVSHGGFYQSFMYVLMGMPGVAEYPSDSEDTRWFSMLNTAVTRIDFSPRGVFVVYTNNVDHLPAELIT